jgi:hypothetical protein
MRNVEELSETEGKRPVGRNRHRRKDNINKMYLQ